jgi:hypothetical protein
MTLLPGCRFAVAPHFHVPADWPRRLRIGAGIEEDDGRFFPRGPWRPLTAEELGLLVSDAAGLAPPDLDATLCLFQLPEHLRSAWWQLLDEAAAAGDAGLAGFDVFGEQLGEFLAFKGLPVAGEARCDVVVSKPGQRSARWDPEANRAAGMSCSLAPWVSWPDGASARGPGLWGAINLGDEETSAVLINLPGKELEAELRRRRPDEPAAADIGELAERFLRSYPNYPVARLLLGPGEGYRLPVGGLILDGYPEGKQEPDVLLLIVQEEAKPGPAS